MGRDLPVSSRTQAPRASLKRVPSLKMCPHLDGLAHRERRVAHGTALTRPHLAQVEPGRHLDVPAHVDAAQVEIVLVGARGHAAATLEGRVGQDPQVRNTHRTQASRRRSQRGPDLRFRSGPHVAGAGGVLQLLLRQGVIAAQQHQRGLAVEHVDEGLDLLLRGRPVLDARQVFDGANAWRRELLGGVVRLSVFRCGDLGRRLLQVGRIAAGATRRNVVLAGVASHDELHRLASAHYPRRGFDGHGVDAATGEDLAVGLEVALEGAVQPLRVQVERVRILHGELAHAHESRLGARLVAKLGLDLVPDLGELLVAPQLARHRGEDLLRRHAQNQVGVPAVLQPEHLLADGIPATTAPPDLARVQRRESALLGAHGIHLVAYDGGDLVAHAHAQGQQRVDSRHELPNEAGAHQKLVADGFGIGGIVAKCGNERLGPAHRSPPSPDSSETIRLAIGWFR